MTTTAQAIEALDRIDKLEVANGACCTIRQHIESTAAELESLKHDIAHALRAATSEATENERLQAECEALRKDAVRYRWLRGGKARTGGGPRRGRIEVFRWLDRSEGEQLKGETLDAAIDAALSTSTAPSGAEE